MVRLEAIQTSSTLKKINCVDTLTVLFDEESRRNQLAILRCLQHIKDEKAISFLKQQFNHESSTVKLETAICMKALGYQGIKQLKALREETDDKQVIASINHVMDRRI